MVKILTILGLIASAFLVSSAPWVSALIYSVVSVMQPQYIWFWVFEDIQVFRISAAIAIIAWIFCAFRGQVNWKVYSSGQFIGMVGLLIIFYLSTWLTPFETYSAAVGGDLVVSIFTTIFIMYFIVLGILNKPEIVKYFAFMFIGITLYYCYWANDHYFSSNWAQFLNGRLRGPDLSPYKDGNVFSIVFTIGLSFILFGLLYFKRKWIKVALVLSLPFVFHALILFASRGALLSAGVLVLFFAFVVKSKSLNVAIVVGFIGMLIWQGGALTDRTSSTIAQAKDDYVEQPLNPRLVSWGIGWGLAKEYPLLGVGPQRFQFASRIHYPEKARHVAHNTFLNFAANTGFIAGFIYLMFFYWSYKQYKFVKAHAEPDSDHGFVNLAAMGGLIAYFVGAIFLDLIIFEPFYFLLMLISANYYMVRETQQEAHDKAAEKSAVATPQSRLASTQLRTR